MKRLIRPAEPPDYGSYLEGIRDSKKAGPAKQQLTDYADVVRERYNAFSIAFDQGRLHELVPLAASVELAAALRSCYGRNMGVRAIKAAIKVAQPPRQLKYCPMCGTTLPGTHDHYLPGVRFPEYSVHPVNLVPCCAMCNSTKDDGWLTPAGQREYLCFYSDELANERYLRVELHQVAILTGVGATFSLVRPKAMSTRLWEHIQSHYGGLRLLERYAECANDEIADMLASCAIHIRNGGMDARQFLMDHAIDAARVYGSSHWRAVLMESLAEADDLEKWVDEVPAM